MFKDWNNLGAIYKKRGAIKHFMKTLYKHYLDIQKVNCYFSELLNITRYILIRGEWAVRLPHAPIHGKPAPLFADEARSASAGHYLPDLCRHPSVP
jgi:hypothetical protein